MSSEQPTVVAIAVVRRENDFLVGIRPEGVPLAGYAEFPGGKLQRNETPSEAAQRECFEESGLSAQAQSELLCVRHQYDHGLLEIHFMDCRVTGNEVPRPPFRWLPRADLAKLKFPEANAPLTRLLLAENALLDRHSPA